MWLFAAAQICSEAQHEALCGEEGVRGCTASLAGQARATFSSINHFWEWEAPLSRSCGSAACIKIKPLKACVPKPYWTYLHQWSQRLRTLMIWTHWGLLLRAYRLAARSPINSFLLKLFARQHKSIMFWLRTGGGRRGSVWNMSEHIYIVFPDECRKWMADMHEEKKRGSVVWLYWNIHFSIDFHKRCICDDLIFSPLNRAELHIMLSLVLRQN